MINDVFLVQINHPWTLDCGLDCRLDYGLDYRLDYRLECRLDYRLDCRLDYGLDWTHSDQDGKTDKDRCIWQMSP